MAVRARFFDDYRLSRIEEEADRLSLHSDISCSVDMATAASICSRGSFTAQRSASADGTLESTADDDDDNDDDDYELPLPPPHLTYVEQTMTKTSYCEKSLQTQTRGESDAGASDDDMSRAALRALHFMQAKYDSLGKVKIEKPISGMTLPSPTTNPEPTASVTSPEDRPRSTVMSQLPTVNGSTRNESANCVNANCVTMAKSEICFKLQSGCSRCASHCPDYCARTSSSTTGDHCLHDDHHSGRPRQSMHGCDHSGNCCDVSRVKNEPVRTTSFDQSGTDVVGHSSLCGSVTKQQQQQQQQQQHQQRTVAGMSSSHHQQQQQHGSQSSTSSNTATGSSTKRRALPLTTAELFQVDLFYRSFKTVVHVSTCTATLYNGSASTTEHQQASRSHQSNHQQQHHPPSKTDWKPAASGIPVIVLDQRNPPSRLYVVLAERGTGFELWRQTLDKTDQYAAMSVNDEPVFHVINCPSDGDSQRGGAVCVRKMGLHFDDPLAATEFHRQLLRLADHDRIALLGGGRTGKKKLGKKAGGKGKRSISFSKADISQPCCFTHVTRLERDNGTNTLFSRQSDNTNTTTIRRH